MGRRQPKPRRSKRPNLRSQPERDKGRPIWRDSRAFIPDRPSARFQEKEKPNLRLIVPAKLPFRQL